MPPCPADLPLEDASLPAPRRILWRNNITELPRAPPQRPRQFAEGASPFWAAESTHLGLAMPRRSPQRSQPGTHPGSGGGGSKRRSALPARAAVCSAPKRDKGCLAHHRQPHHRKRGTAPSRFGPLSGLTPRESGPNALGGGPAAEPAPGEDWAPPRLSLGADPSWGAWRAKTAAPLHRRPSAHLRLESWMFR